jgi:CDP-4-dehydro-6-deoxyglucose reductase
MSKSTRLLPSEIEFQLSDVDTILNAALSENINLEYSCKNGHCGQCRAVLVEGDVTVLEEIREQVALHSLDTNEILT